MTNDDILDVFFTYHAPRQGDKERYEKIRAAAKEFARVIMDQAKEGHDFDESIRHVRAAVMWANAQIAIDGGIGEFQKSCPHEDGWPTSRTQAKCKRCGKVIDLEPADFLTGS